MECNPGKQKYSGTWLKPCTVIRKESPHVVNEETSSLTWSSISDWPGVPVDAGATTLWMSESIRLDSALKKRPYWTLQRLKATSAPNSQRNTEASTEHYINFWSDSIRTRYVNRRCKKMNETRVRWIPDPHHIFGDNSSSPFSHTISSHLTPSIGSAMLK